MRRPGSAISDFEKKRYSKYISFVVIYNHHNFFVTNLKPLKNVFPYSRARMTSLRPCHWKIEF